MTGSSGPPRFRKATFRALQDRNVAFLNLAGGAG
jgi:hypothetical protein